MNYTRCQNCGRALAIKPGVKKLKNCPPCRQMKQDRWRDKIRRARQSRTENKQVEAPGPLNV